jgi:hypothetical protein
MLLFLSVDPCLRQCDSRLRLQGLRKFVVVMYVRYSYSCSYSFRRFDEEVQTASVRERKREGAARDELTTTDTEMLKRSRFFACILAPALSLQSNIICFEIAFFCSQQIWPDEAASTMRFPLCVMRWASQAGTELSRRILISKLAACRILRCTT